jgi:hypothetical protein
LQQQQQVAGAVAVAVTRCQVRMVTVVAAAVVLPQRTEVVGAM